MFSTSLDCKSDSWDKPGKCQFDGTPCNPNNPDDCMSGYRCKLPMWGGDMGRCAKI